MDSVWPPTLPDADTDPGASVPLRDLLRSPAFASADGTLTVALGLDDRGELRVADLALAPHLLVAGTTGSGKSTFVHALISSLLVRYHADELRLVLVDTGGLELPAYNGIAHLLCPAVTSPADAVLLLKWGAMELDVRRTRLAEHGCRTIAEFNRRSAHAAGITPGSAAAQQAPALPSIIYIIDDVTGLTTYRPDASDVIAILAEHGRPLGLHLILVTSRPTSPFVTGDVKRLIPSRVAFHLPARADSRTVFDQPGAEHLEGLGSMLYLGPDTGTPVLLRTGYISQRETERLVTFMVQRYPVHDHRPDVLETTRTTVAEVERPDWFEAANTEADALLYDAALIVIQHEQGSTSLLQRRLKIGYGHAAHLIDQLHRAGVLGPPDGARPRDVCISLKALERRAKRR